jgi:Cft2 family RNA processing exonuclease
MVPLTKLMTASNEELSCLALATGQGEEGVCLLVKIGDYRLLLDCGITDITPLLELEIDGLWCSHAHRHHTQGLRNLQQALPQLPIYTSSATAILIGLEAGVVLPWQQSIEDQSPLGTELFPGLYARIFPAGHLPGAAAILFTYQGLQRSYTLLYTGDFFISNTRLTEGISLNALRGTRPDVLIVEGSYGTTRYPHRRQQENNLVQQLNGLLAEFSTIYWLLPELGQAQEILVLLRGQMAGQKVEIWVDQNIEKICDQYVQCLPELPNNIQNFARDRSLFWDDRSWPRVEKCPKAPTTGILLISDLASIVQDSDIANGSIAILVPPEYLELASSTGLSIHSYFLSEHSDGAGTTQLIHNLRPQHVMLVHGSATYLADLTGLEELHSRYQLHLPSAGSLVELPIGDTFLHTPPPIESTYEGELATGSQLIHISLPTTVAEDPRWQKFADTGLVEARWQGEELILRGVSARQLLNYPEKVAADLSCCGNCEYLRGQRCLNTQSPLHGFKVTATGLCRSFAPNRL